MFKSVVDGHLNRRQWLSRCVVAFVYGSSFASLLRRRLFGPLTRSPSRPTVSHHPLHPCSTLSRYLWPHTDCLNHLSTSCYLVQARLGPASTGTLSHLGGQSQWLAAFDSCPRDGFRQFWSRCHTTRRLLVPHCFSNAHARRAQRHLAQVQGARLNVRGRMPHDPLGIGVPLPGGASVPDRGPRVNSPT